MKWSSEYRVHYYYTDYNNVLKTSYIARYMQETAWSSLKEWGTNPQYLTERNLAFILSKISFRYYSEIYEDDIIKVETWENPAKTVIFPRNYRVYNISQGGEIAAEATSAWALMDMKEKSIIKPSIIPDDLKKNIDDEEMGFAVQRRFKIPETASTAEYAKYAEYKVRYSDIDTNLHMNNAAYIDLICDNLYYDGEELSPNLKKKILSLDLNYNTQVVLGDVIGINKSIAVIKNHEHTDNIKNIKNIKNIEEHYFNADIKSSGQNCFEAKVVKL